MNAEVTAENRPDCTKPHGKHPAQSDSSSPLCSTRADTHKDKRGIQVFVVFLLKILVVFIHFPLKLVVELHSGVETSCSAA